MGGQTLGLGQRNGRARQLFKGASVTADQGGPLQEIIDGQARAKARGPAGGQDMVGPGHIIANRFRRMAAKEYGPGMAHAVGQGLRLLNRKLDVFGRDSIDQTRAVL